METLNLVPIETQVIEDRRHLHMHPEPSFKEHETARWIAERLRLLNLDVQTAIAGTGVVGLIRGARPGRTVLLRADIDALPIQELNDVPYRSQTPGVMHACGHDAHTAMLLGAARVLAERRGQITGNVKLVFQPGEEQLPGGAAQMIAAGVLETPHVDAAFGLHVYPVLPVGTIAVRAGTMVAGFDVFTLEITGRSGHPYARQHCIDPILPAAQIVTALHSLVARELDPQEAAGLAVTSIHGSTATCNMKGIMQFLSTAARDHLRTRTAQVATSTAEAFRATCDCTITPGYDPVHNDPAMTNLVVHAASELLGADNVVTVPPIMAADDFAGFLNAVPGTYIALGVRNEARGITSNVHEPHMDVDEDALMVGVNLFTAVTERFLASA